MRKWKELLQASNCASDPALCTASSMQERQASQQVQQKEGRKACPRAAHREQRAVHQVPRDLKL